MPHWLTSATENLPGCTARHGQTRRRRCRIAETLNVSERKAHSLATVQKAIDACVAKGDTDAASAIEATANKSALKGEQLAKTVLKQSKEVGTDSSSPPSVATESKLRKEHAESRKLLDMLGLSHGRLIRFNDGPTEHSDAVGKHWTAMSKEMRAWEEDDRCSSIKADGLRDGLGNPVPEHLLHVFAECDKFDEAARMASKAKSLVNELSASPANYHLSHQIAQSDLANARTAILMGKPHVPCPRKGTNHVGCPVCKELGYVTKEMFKALPEEFRACDVRENVPAIDPSLN